MKVIFQSTNPYLFRSVSIGYLYEISQKHKTVLMTEKLDSYTEKILEDKNLFPGLEEIIIFEAPFNKDIFGKNYRLWKLSKKVIQDYKPDIVVTQDDFWPMSLYLLRFAKKAGIVTLALQDGFRVSEGKKLYLWSCLMNTYNKMPHFLPFALRFFLVKVKKYLGHFFYYWILPLTVFERPFFGKASFVFWNFSPGLRDADYSAVFSKRDYDLSLKDGVKKEKLFIIGHPLTHKKTKNFFEKVYFSKNKNKEDEKTVTIMWPEEKIGFRNKDYSLISEREMRENRKKVVKLISEKLSDWKIFIKPHPAVKNALVVKEFLGEIPNNVSIAEPSEPSDKYIEMSKVIIGFSLPSTALFTASLQSPPEKIILHLDLNQEFLGDCYKDFNGIEYIDNEERLIRVLDSIKDGTFRKKQRTLEKADFSDAAEFIDYLYAKRVS